MLSWSLVDIGRGGHNDLVPIAMSLHQVSQC